MPIKCDVYVTSSNIRTEAQFVFFHNISAVQLTAGVFLCRQVAKFLLTGDNSLYILLPITNTLTDLQQVESRMTDGNVRQMIEQLNAASPQNIEVTLPQIKLDVEPNMIALLKKLGLLVLHASFCHTETFSLPPMILTQQSSIRSGIPF